MSYPESKLINKLSMSEGASECPVMKAPEAAAPSGGLDLHQFPLMLGCPVKLDQKGGAQNPFSSRFTPSYCVY